MTYADTPPQTPRGVLYECVSMSLAIPAIDSPCNNVVIEQACSTTSVQKRKTSIIITCDSFPYFTKHNLI